MIDFRFINLWLLSPRDRKANRVEFHPLKNLIHGSNHTGKSTIIKNLFLTLGARPEGKLERWDQQAISVVQFSVNSVKFFAVHQDGQRALFDGKLSLIVATTDSKEWAQSFRTVVDFNLVLTKKSGGAADADASCFFLLFYINQDGSWQSGWNTFPALRQFKAPISTIIDYFSGFKPADYYRLLSERNSLQVKLSELGRERAFFLKAKDKLDSTRSEEALQISEQDFQDEIESLVFQCEKINSEQEILRDDAVRQREVVHRARQQIKLAENTLSGYRKDVGVLRDTTEGPLVCPTCGAHHSNSFVEIFEHAEDARVLTEIVKSLEDDIAISENLLGETELKIAKLNKDYSKISSILSVRKEGIDFSDIVRRMAENMASAIFKDEAMSFDIEIGDLDSKISELKSNMDFFTDKERAKEILKVFRSAYSQSLVDLNMDPINIKKVKLSSRPNVSGSGGPRSILAYYAGLWAATQSEYSAFQMPIIIDAPQQQGQDDVNLPRIISFIAGGLKTKSQVIVAVEAETDAFFDRRTNLSIPYGLLEASKFSEIDSFTAPLVRAMNEANRSSQSDSD